MGSEIFESKIGPQAIKSHKNSEGPAVTGTDATFLGQNLEQDTDSRAGHSLGQKSELGQGAFGYKHKSTKDSKRK